MRYAELHTISNFTFLRGASHPGELVESAAKLGYEAIAITDECSLAGIVKAYLATRTCSVKLIAGSEFLLTENIKLVLLAPDRQAYSEISTLITHARRRSQKGEYHISIHDLIHTTRHCLCIWLPESSGCRLQQTIRDITSSHKKNYKYGEKLKSIFTDRLWLGVTLYHQTESQQYYLQLHALAETLNIPMLACGDVHMHTRSRKPLQDTLTAIRTLTPVDQSGIQLQINAERYLRPLKELHQIYPAALLTETVKLASRCHFQLTQLRYQYPEEVVPANLTPITYLTNLVEQGIHQRWPSGVKQRVQKQIHTELKLIEQLRYEYYFLTVYDIVQFARSQNIYCQGRGSAANSAVCYCLFITEVDPARSNLLFERFISKERDEPPDIDVDFEHERREEVIQYIYKKYGRDRAAIAATVVCYRPRSAIRDVGKALGLKTSLINNLTKSLAWWDKRDELICHFAEAGLKQNSRLAEAFIDLIQNIQGFPRHLSQHVGGFVITQQPVSTLVPIENAAMADRTIIQWDKDDLEAAGLLKVDILALGILSAIKKCLHSIQTVYQTPLTLADIPDNDTATFDMICQADTVGVFQIESRAQMSMLPRLKPRNYYDLVIEVAIVRPGPIQGEMVHPYLRRRNRQEAESYPSDALKPILKRTLGVPIFQEQAIKISMVAAGFSGGEADQLRRAMASWHKGGELYRFKEKFIQGMLQHGYSFELAERLFKQIEGFGGYGFPESHSASFAILAYQSAWLKCHYPAAFYCALLNSQPMGFYTPSQLIQDARRHQLSIKPVDVRYSQWEHSLEPAASVTAQPAIRLGLRLIKGLQYSTVQRLLQAREQTGFSSIEKCYQHTGLNQTELSAIANANALYGLSGHRYQSHWEIQAITEKKPLETEQENLHDHIFLSPPSETDNLIADYASTGLTLNRHPMAILRCQSPYNRCKTAIQVQQSAVNHRFVRIAGVVTGRQRPGTASGVIFMTLEDETGNFNVIIWKDIQNRYRQALLKARILYIKGVIESNEGVTHIVAGHIEDHTHVLPFDSQSRDFH